MRRVWAALLAVWATLAIVAALAWTHPAAAPARQATPVTVLVAGKNGKLHPVRVFVAAPGTTAHSATHSSPVR
jgi:cyanate permease